MKQLKSRFKIQKVRFLDYVILINSKTNDRYLSI